MKMRHNMPPAMLARPHFGFPLYFSASFWQFRHSVDSFVGLFGHWVNRLWFCLIPSHHPSTHLMNGIRVDGFSICFFGFRLIIASSLSNPYIFAKLSTTFSIFAAMFLSSNCLLLYFEKVFQFFTWGAVPKPLYFIIRREGAEPFTKSPPFM